MKSSKEGVCVCVCWNLLHLDIFRFQNLFKAQLKRPAYHMPNLDITRSRRKAIKHG